MELTDNLQRLKPMAEEMGVALYQRFTEDEAATFLHIPIESLKLIQGQGKIAFIKLDENTTEYMGYQLLEYLIGNISQTNFPQQQSITHDRIIRAKEVMKMIGLSRTTLWRLEKYKSFPARISLGKGSVGWKLSEVQKWVINREKL